ncbi:MAG: MFS transporter [Verrucomicrobia bacterium]|nr:MFS transporter [Verrucomicrobiota bacterium]
MKFSNKTYSWAVVGMLWCICFLNFADRQVIYSIFPLLEKEFHFSKFQLGLIGSAFIWVYATLALLAGFVTDRWSRKFLIIGGCFFWSVMTWSTAWCSQFWQFVVVRGCDGLGEAFYLPSAMSLLADYHGRKTRSTAFSFHFLESILESLLEALWEPSWHNTMDGAFLFIFLEDWVLLSR